MDESSKDKYKEVQHIRGFSLGKIENGETNIMQTPTQWEQGFDYDDDDNEWVF